VGGDKDFKYASRLIVTSWSQGWQIIPQRVMVRSPVPYKCEMAPTISLERLKLEWSNFVYRLALSSPRIWRTNHP